MTAHVVVYDDAEAHTSVSVLMPCLKDSFSGMMVKTAATPEFLRTLKGSPGTLAVIPGIWGEKSSYYDLLGGEHGMRGIRDFVERGGLLMTICAGSYLVAQKTEYVPPWGPARSRVNPAPLFNALARGPVSPMAVNPGHAAFWYDDCTVLPVSYKDTEGNWQTAGFAYGNGPALLDFEDKGVEILARFNTASAQPVAAAWKTMGAGAVLWLGILPYMGYDPTCENIGMPKLDRLMAELKPHEAARRQFWDNLASRMKNHLQRAP